MPLKDILPKRPLPGSRLPPSRIRHKLAALEAKLRLESPALALFTTGQGRSVNVGRLLQEVQAAQAEFLKLDALQTKLKQQRRSIVAQLPLFLELLSVTNLLLRNLHPRPRRRLTGPEQVIANALNRSTRALRKTLGPRQREKLYPGSRKR